MPSVPYYRRAATLRSKREQELAAWGRKAKALTSKPEEPPRYPPDSPWSRLNNLTSTLRCYETASPLRLRSCRHLAAKLIEVAEQFELGGFPERDVARFLRAIAQLSLEG